MMVVLRSHPKFQNFSEAFHWHFENGTRGGVTTDQPWRRKEFATAVATSLDKTSEKDYSNTVKGWEKGATPQERFIKTILVLFFGDDQQNVDRKEFDRLWNLAASRILGASQALPAATCPSAMSEAWPVTDAERMLEEQHSTVLGNIVLEQTVPVQNEQLFDIMLHRPPQGSTPNSFEVLATLNLGLRPDREGPLRWSMGVKRFVLLDRSEGCQLEPGSSCAREGVVRQARGWIVATANHGNAVMSGDLLPGDALARMQHDGKSEAIKVILHAKCEADTDLDIILEKKPRSLSLKREQAIKRYLQVCHRDSDDSVFLGEARLIWTVKT